MTISIILPTFNRAHLLERAVGSVLRQSYPDWQLVVIDDGSADETPRLAKQWTDSRIAYDHVHHGGSARARNAGLERAKGEWITFLDSDDEYLPQHLETRVEYIRAHPGMELLHGGIRVIGEQTVPDKNDPTRLIPLVECVIGGTFFIKAELVKALGGFSELDYSEDSDLFERAERAGAVIHRIDDATYLYHREHADSITNMLASKKDG